MSLRKVVTEMVNERNCDTTADDLVSRCGGFTRRQIAYALRGAKAAGEIAKVQSGDPSGTGSGVYRPLVMRPARFAGLVSVT